ncbi:MAG TPA: cbb3-type cytochrome c oxidase subunit I [Candidatus Dormibacteraeota bacterium]|nr:cbb3-type cytochrome c oxidase subunit I [Candidatus Dormibacteraeota bacterium]
MAVNPKKLRPYDEPPRRRRSLAPGEPDSAAKAFLVVAALWLLVATGLGAAWIGGLLFPEQLTFRFEIPLPIIGALPIEISSSTDGAAFTNALVYGWLSNAAFGAILFITPRISGARLAGERMAFMAVGAWNLAVAGGIGAVYLPTVAQPGRLAEFPFLIDGLMLLAMLMVNAVFWRTVVSARQRLPYVSIWFFGVALLAVMGVYALGAAAELGVFLISLDQTVVALVKGFMARSIETYWVLGVSLGTLFYVVPRATGNPLASIGMAMTAWLLWAGLSAMSALGALVDPSVPFVITMLGNVGTMLLVAPVYLTVATLALTIQGRWSLVLSAGTLAFAVVSMAFLLATGLLEAIGALRTVQGQVRGTEWGIGVWLFGSLGTATFASFAVIDHATPRLFRRDWGGTVLTDAQLWATFAGATLAGVALIFGGIAHGSLLAQAAPPDEITGTLRWFLMAAGAGISLAALGSAALLGALFLMYTTARKATYAAADAVAAAGGH